VLRPVLGVDVCWPFASRRLGVAESAAGSPPGLLLVEGDDVITIELDGEVDKLQVRGRVVADGQNSNAIHISGDSPDLTTLQVMASHGRTDGRTSIPVERNWVPT